MAGVETDLLRPEHEGVALETFVERGVGNDQRGFLRGQRVGAEGDAARYFARVDSLPGLEPQPVFVQKRDRRHRHAEKPRRQPRDAVETLLRGRVQEVQGAQRLQALALVRRREELDHDRGMEIICVRRGAVAGPGEGGGTAVFALPDTAAGAIAPLST